VRVRTSTPCDLYRVPWRTARGAAGQRLTGR
jgi:hypothetical protein